MTAVPYAGYLWHSWTRPEVIRQMLIAELQERFLDVEVEVGSAQLRLLGGIAVRDLRLTRRGDRLPFLVVPEGKLFHDKEQLAKKKLRLRKIELDAPTLRVERFADGSLNLDGILRPVAPTDDPVPTLVMRNATIAAHDAAAGDAPVASVLAEMVTLVNDPKPTLVVEGHGKITPLGPLRFRVTLDRDTNKAELSLDLPNVHINADLLRIAARYRPEMADIVDQIEGIAKFHLDARYDPRESPALHHETRLELLHGRVSHPKLPLPLEGVEIVAVCRDGQLTVEKAEAKAGTAQLRASLELLPPGADDPTPTLPVSFTNAEELPDAIASRLKRVELTVDGLKLDAELFGRLPEKLRAMQNMLSPAGPVGLTFVMAREAGGWTKRCVFRPLGLTAAYDKFRFPLEDLRGSVDYINTEAGGDRVEVDLVAKATGRKVTIKGFITDRHGETDVDIRIAGNGVPLSETLFGALPKKAGDFLRELRADVTGDFVATIRQLPGTRLLAKEFRIQLRDGRMYFDLFPYPLEHIQGTVVITPAHTDLTRFDEPPSEELSFDDVIELKGITASHNGARVTLNGRKERSPAGSTMTLQMEGRNVPLDAELRKGFTGFKFEPVWDQLRPSGVTNFSMKLLLHERPRALVSRPGGTNPPFDPINDVEMAVVLDGGTIRPEFFAMPFDEIGGRVEYARGKVDIIAGRARHADARIDLRSAEVRTRPDGGVYADLRNVVTTPFYFDAEVMGALPAAVRKSLKELQFAGRAELNLTRFVIDAPAAPNDKVRLASTAPPAAPPATVYWDGMLTMRGNELTVGTKWVNVVGKIASRGRYEGDRFGAVVGNVVLDEATIARQPIKQAHARLEIDPRQPHVVVLRWFEGKLYGGDVGGQGLLDISHPTPSFDIKFNATGVQLAEVARAYQLKADARLEGSAAAQLFLSNRTESGLPAAELYGGGSVDVPSGKVLNLPKMLDLFKLLNLRKPDQTAFEEVHAAFTIRGDRLVFTHLDLMGNAISLGGDGEVNMASGATDFEFYTIWSRWMRGWLRTPVGEVAAELSSMLFKVEVKGDFNGKVDFRKVTVPVVVEPVRRVVERMRRSNTYQRNEGTVDGN